jgi:hypothetical protein
MNNINTTHYIHIFENPTNILTMIQNSQKEKASLDRYLRMPLVGGSVIGFAAALVQALLMPAGGPEAYGFCVACHTRDLVDVAFNSVFGTSLFAAPISVNAVLPVMTIIGVLLGAVLAAKCYKEFRIKKGDLKSYASYGIGGFLFMVFALMMGACPYRLALRIGYGDAIAVIGLVAIVIGVFIGVKLALKKMEGK